MIAQSFDTISSQIQTFKKYLQISYEFFFGRYNFHNLKERVNFIRAIKIVVLIGVFYHPPLDILCSQLI